MRTFTKDTALSEQGRGAARLVWINARHGRGTAWARHALCESAFSVPPAKHMVSHVEGWFNDDWAFGIHLRVVHFNYLFICATVSFWSNEVLVLYPSWRRLQQISLLLYQYVAPPKILVLSIVTVWWVALLICTYESQGSNLGSVIGHLNGRYVLSHFLHGSSGIVP